MEIIAEGISLNTLLLVATVVLTLGGIGFKLAQIVSRIELSVAEIKGVLVANSARLDRIEREIKELDERIRHMEKS